jgi:hypothetical protein
MGAVPFQKKKKDASFGVFPFSPLFFYPSWTRLWILHS